jgi:hypothetical protein
MKSSTYSLSSENAVPPPELETRLLVCEGKCNPDLKDYDMASSRTARACAEDLEDGPKYQPTTSDARFFGGWARKLKHTTHTCISSINYHNNGWKRKYQCNVCGRSRWF